MTDAFVIKPQTPVSKPDTVRTGSTFSLMEVAPVVGMSSTFIGRVLGRKTELNEDDIRILLDQDAFSETFVPRSRVLQYLREHGDTQARSESLQIDDLICGDAVELLQQLPTQSIDCVVTSTPYWAMRVYDTVYPRSWADGEHCTFGLEQTPEGFIRHSVEILYHLLPAMKLDGSVWWNLMDSYNTRTQIRSNAAEALHAMQGHDKRRWSDHMYRRYSAGHSYLEDGEQCLIPQRVAERASRIGYLVKSLISWCKVATTPEPQQSRVSRNVEYILHLSPTRTPKFHKSAYLANAPELGGRQPHESDKLADSWILPTSAGRNGHGAQFPLQLPARCIALTTDPGDVVLDPFIGAGTTAIAARALGRHYLGFDISEEYIAIAQSQLRAHNQLPIF